MKLENSRSIQAAPQAVWDNLISIDVLQQCIPGCQSMEQTGDNDYALTMKSKVGPVAATFKGKLSLRDIVAGESYTLYFEGQGGTAGFSKGSSEVRLKPVDTGTELRYTVEATIGGKIAQLGQRLVDGAARKMAKDFFDKFEAIVAPSEKPPCDEPGELDSGATPPTEEPPKPQTREKRRWNWFRGEK